ncbi:MAG: TIGR01459 family HAD-type hydrolase [Rhodospirillaceae bacterium]|nr:TIGR01459 family HAD-type hydrolase [Rhodospirillaceae bacterium]
MSFAFPVWRGISAFVDQYDVFILDLWGVLHDGVSAYAEAAETLSRLKASGKRIVLLSNAPRRVEALVAVMTEMGLPRQSYDAIYSSGEATRHRLQARQNAVFSDLGRRLFFVGQDKDRDLYAGLDYISVDDPADADFVLACGPFDFDDSLAAYKSLVERIAETRVPMICANPDRGVIRAGKNVVCAGNIADLYAAIGGAATFVGKPDAAVYHEALALVGVDKKARIVGIGDGLDTDIAGCCAAGIDAVLCAGGVNALKLGTVHGESPNIHAVRTLVARHGQEPIGAIPAFVWGV